MFTVRTALANALSASLLLGACGLAGPVGCATADHGRLHDKMDAYEARAASYKTKLSQTSDPVRRVSYLNTLIGLTDSQITCANRVNPQTNPGIAAGTMTIEDARKEKDATIEKLKATRADYVRQRDAIAAGQSSGK